MRNKSKEQLEDSDKGTDLALKLMYEVKEEMDQALYQEVTRQQTFPRMDQDLYQGFWFENV